MPLGAAVRPWPAVLLAAALLLPGCLDPYRPTVAATALQGSGLTWARQDRGGGSLVETAYTTDPASQPPYPGMLQLFGLRDGGRLSTDELLRRTRDSVDNATRSNGIELEGGGTQGSRTLRNGLATQWFALEGTVTGPSGLFQQQQTVRILGEAGFDGRSQTHVIAVAIAQVEATTCPIVGPCSTRTDLRTWNAIVGDPEGSVGFAVSENGLIDHVVSHG